MLRVDLADLDLAFGDPPGEASSYLDLESGRVVRVSDEVQRELAGLYEETFTDRFLAARAEAAEEAVLADAMERRAVPAWRREALREAWQVDVGLGVRYVRVPAAEPAESYRLMEAFVGTVPNERLQDHLWEAIRGRGAFRRFKDVLAGHARERERWYTFRDARVREEVLAWLASLGIAPIPEKG